MRSDINGWNERTNFLYSRISNLPDVITHTRLCKGDRVKAASFFRFLGKGLLTGKIFKEGECGRKDSLGCC